MFLKLFQCVYFISSRSQGETPLHLASMEGHLNITNLLLKFGANVNVTDITVRFFCCCHYCYRLTFTFQKAILACHTSILIIVVV